MERKITVGYWYIVGGPAGATVTVKGEVNPCCTVPEGGQGSFYAQAPVVIVSDEAITLSQVVNFKCAPVKRWLLGLGRGVSSVLPSGYLAAEFLTSNLKEYIDTGIILNQDSQVDLVFKANSRYEDGYLFGSRVTINQDAFTFYAATPGNTFFNYNADPPLVLSLNKSVLGVLKIRGPEWHVSYDMGDGTVKEASRTFVKKSFNTPSSCCLMAYNQVDGNVKKGFTGNVYSLSIANQWGSQGVFTPAISADGKPCMYDSISRKPFYNIGTGSFIVGMTLEQARNLSKLPATGGSLTVSLPWEAQLVQHNAEVEAALQTAKGKGWTITVQYREPEADSAVYNKYAACTTVEEMLAVNDDYKNDLTADGAWIYPLPKLQNAEMAFASMRCKSATFYMPELVRGRRIFQVLGGKPNYYAETVEVYAPKLILKSNYYEGVELIFLEARIRALKVEFSPQTVRIDRDFAIHGLQNFEMNEMPNLTGLPSAFQYTELNKTSILRLIEQLPTWESGNHPATFGVHTDLQTDEDVIAAIADAEAKGWTLAVQWNGTATAQAASTFGLRKPPIYAKLDNIECADGTSEATLDWGHYVTDWEANGYQEFASVEEAKEYFNIKENA